MVNRLTAMKSMGKNIADVVQKKSTPFKKPRNNGGSPKGVKDPPILATRKIKNTITCTLLFRSLLARIRGRIKSMAAPVVPIQLANTVPNKMTPVFTIGFPTSEPVSCTPPDIVNNDNKRIMNGIYSKSPTWSNS